MYNLNDIKEYAPCNRWTAKINTFFNTKLEDRDIYTIFDMVGIEKKRRNVGGREFYAFDKDDVEPKLYDGSIRSAVIRLKDNKGIPNVDNQNPVKRTNFKLSNPNDERIVKRGRRNIILPKSDNEVVNDNSEYRNGEDDMESYSNYLINNVYQFENIVRKAVTESLNKLLK